jgi:hypothetical protein
MKHVNSIKGPKKAQKMQKTQKPKKPGIVSVVTSFPTLDKKAKREGAFDPITDLPKQPMLTFAKRMRELAMSVRPASVSGDAVVDLIFNHVTDAVEARAREGKLSLVIDVTAELDIEDSDTTWSISELSDRQVHLLIDCLTQQSGLTAIVRTRGVVTSLVVNW